MTVIELWRVLDDHPAAPGHLVRQTIGDARCVTACGWATRAPGQFIDRAELFARHRFGCRFCMRAAKWSDSVMAQARTSNMGGRS